MNDKLSLNCSRTERLEGVGGGEGKEGVCVWEGGGGSAERDGV